MGSESRNRVLSGIEPVDELMGGLEVGQLYLVNGEASGKSLFGIKFLIEGLKQSENAALVIRYSPEDAVRRFARLGYDCLEDVYSGRLVILEYSDDIIQKIGRLRELTPVLRELEWLLGETRPQRLIFDPVTSVVAIAEGNIESRAREFAEWARSFGATVLLIANGSDNEIIESFQPLVAESFRFDVKEVSDRVTRFIAFEKSPEIPDQAIEVDPSRGIFLLGGSYVPARAAVHPAAPQPRSIAELESIREELRSVRDRIRKEESQSHIDLIAEAEAEPEPASSAIDTTGQVSESQFRTLQTRKLTPTEERESQFRKDSEPAEPVPIEELSIPFEGILRATPTDRAAEDTHDELSDLLDDLTGTESPLELDLPELQAATPEAYEKRVEPDTDRPLAAEVREQQAAVSSDAQSSAVRDAGETRHGRASDLKIDSAMAARAVDLLLRPPETDSELQMAPAARPREVREEPQLEPVGDAEVRPKDFNVLIIEDDAETCDLLTQTLAEYTLEVEHDGVSGLAKLISFKSDLVVLDFDLPIIDGFKVLTLIRSALNVPIIIVSGSRMRAIDRVMAGELGADYYLTKPFSAKELKHKARQLIARYRGINSWILSPPGGASPQTPARDSESATASTPFDHGQFIPYTQFAAEVENRVKSAMDDGASFSIVGCRLPHMTANGGRLALRLFEIARGLARESDVTSTNPDNDLVVLLADAGAAGARAFAGRLRERVIEELDQEPSLWMRSFPDLEESTEATAPILKPAHGGTPERRSSDRAR